MNLFDHFVFNIFQHYKPKYKSKANSISIIYITFLQGSILLLLGVFFSVFFSQMNVDMMSSKKAWTLFGLAIIALYFKNWMSYSGRKRRVLNAKSTKKKAQIYNIWTLWVLPFGCIALAILLLQKF
ncbi:MAG: hypothetical protein DA407_03915 [Bacteroidetes bacterium]|nr:MAG: hypothetical protein DA407_03915 [Bacteroidota bacterium]